MTEERKTVTEPRRRARWPKFLLVASLTLNVLVLSVVAGALFRGGHDQTRPPPPDRTVLREGGFMPFFDAMPRDARREMAEAFRASEHGRGPDRAVLAADLRDFVQALRAEPFEPANLDAVLEAQHARAQERITAGRTILIDQINRMSPAERAEFADALKRRFQGALDRAPGKPDGGRDGH